MCSVRFQLVSDLHLETPQARPTYEDFKIQPECQYLALLGDIGNICDPRLFKFLEDQLRKFEIVFYLASPTNSENPWRSSARISPR